MNDSRIRRQGESYYIHTNNWQYIIVIMLKEKRKMWKTTPEMTKFKYGFAVKESFMYGTANYIMDK